MIQTIKNFIKMTLIASLLFAPVLVPTLVPATVGAAEPNIEESLKTGSCLDVEQQCDLSDSPEKVNNLVALIINIFSIVVGIVSVIMIIIGGLKYITSSGDSNNVTSAKNTILYAIIGLVIVALAQFIVQFVLSKALDA